MNKLFPEADDKLRWPDCPTCHRRCQPYVEHVERHSVVMAFQCGKCLRICVPFFPATWRGTPDEDYEKLRVEGMAFDASLKVFPLTPEVEEAL